MTPSPGRVILPRATEVVRETEAPLPLFSRNRLNAAISRAQCLAVLVCSPRLREASSQSIEEMQLVNALCRHVEYAEA